MTAIEIYEKETGNKQPSNQIAFHEWHIKYVAWLERQIVKPPAIPAAPYQLCPKCNGQGSVSKPPHVAGDVHEWNSNQISFVCDVCNGAKIIPMFLPADND